MTRAQFRHRAKITLQLIEFIDAARESGRGDLAPYSLPLALLAMIEDLDFDWYLYLRTGVTAPDIRYTEETE